MRVPHTAGLRLFLSWPCSAGSRLLRVSMYPRDHPTEAPPACSITEAPLQHVGDGGVRMRRRRAAHLPLEEDVWEGLVVEAVASQHEGPDEHGGGAVVLQAGLFIRGHGQQLQSHTETGEPAVVQWDEANWDQ